MNMGILNNHMNMLLDEAQDNEKGICVLYSQRRNRLMHRFTNQTDVARIKIEADARLIWRIDNHVIGYREFVDSPDIEVDGPNSYITYLVENKSIRTKFDSNDAISKNNLIW